jgi:hypothetical protein
VDANHIQVIFNPGTFEPVARAMRAAAQNDDCSAEMVESAEKRNGGLPKDATVSLGLPVKGVSRNREW